METDNRLISFKLFEEYLLEAEDDEYTYPGLEEKLTPEMAAILEKFRKEPLETRKNVPFLWYAIGTSTAFLKMSKEDSEYVEESQTEGQTCANCQHIYQHGVSGENYVCDQVGVDEGGQDDSIAKEGWCRLWAPIEKK